MNIAKILQVKINRQPKMGMGKSNIKMGIPMLANSKMAKKMDMEFINSKVEQRLSVIRVNLWIA
jgi:hypothetical protein